MVWSTSTRKNRLPSGWPLLRRRVLERDGYHCQHVRADTGALCGKWANQVDHIVPDFEGGDDSMGNLQSLCGYHHRVKSSAEGARGAGRKRAAAARAERYRHPAFL